MFLLAVIPPRLMAMPLCTQHSKSFFFFFLTSLLEYNCFTMLCQFLLYNKVNQLYVYIHPHIPALLRLLPILPIPPLQVVTEHRADRADLPSDAAASHQLSILHLVVYICQCYCLTSSKFTLPPPRVLKSILYVCIFIPPAPRFFRTTFLFFFRFHIYVLAYGICFSLLTYFTLYDRHQVHPPRYK